MKRVYKIVLTGGSCAGKTTAQKYLMKELSKESVDVLMVPEVASLILANGIDRRRMSVYQLQKYIFNTQIYLESTFEEIAEKCFDNDVVILCDRGSCDGKAFLTSNEWEDILNTYGTTMEKELNRYDAVVYLDSVAISYPEYYMCTAIRTYTADMARKESEAVYEIWKDHDNFYFVKASEDIFEKLEKLFIYVKNILNQVKGD